MIKYFLFPVIVKCEEADIHVVSKKLNDAMADMKPYIGYSKEVAIGPKAKEFPRRKRVMTNIKKQKQNKNKNKNIWQSLTNQAQSEL